MKEITKENKLEQLLNDEEFIDLKLIGIYKIINPKNKIYIGQSVNIEKRFTTYKSLSCKGQIKIYNSLNKYGVENHIFEIIEECDINDLNIRERYWQDYYDVLNQEKGLNCILNESDKLLKILSLDTKNKISESHKGKIISEETKLKISNSTKGRILTKEHCEKISKSNKGKKCPWNTGRPTTEEAKLKISLANKGKKRSEIVLEKMKIMAQLGNNSNSKKVICTKTDKIWDSITECALENNIKPTILMWNLRNPLKSNTTFKYLKDE